MLNNTYKLYCKIKISCNNNINIKIIVADQCMQAYRKENFAFDNLHWVNVRKWFDNLKKSYDKTNI